MPQDKDERIVQGHILVQPFIGISLELTFSTLDHRHYMTFTTSWPSQNDTLTLVIAPATRAYVSHIKMLSVESGIKDQLFSIRGRTWLDTLTFLDAISIPGARDPNGACQNWIFTSEQAEDGENANKILSRELGEVTVPFLGRKVRVMEQHWPGPA
jgi:hypothetical protein